MASNQHIIQRYSPVWLQKRDKLFWERGENDRCEAGAGSDASPNSCITTLFCKQGNLSGGGVRRLCN